MEFNLNEEIRCDYTITPEMKKVWKVQLDMVTKLLEVCEKYNLKIWAEGGTLLGTIRHKGYIPWDDDIDMIMFREDYEKLLAVGEKEFTHPLFLQHYGSENDFFRPFARLRNSETTCLLDWETKEFNFSFNQGIFIDIFVLDGIPDNKKEMTHFGNKIERLRRWNLNIRRTKHASFPGKCLYVLLKILYPNPDKITEELIKTLKKYKISDCDKIAQICFKYGPDRIRQKIWYEETILLPFENIEMPCPAAYDNLLKSMYGDYMTPVKAPTAHGSCFFDTEKPYTDYLNK